MDTNSKQKEYLIGYLFYDHKSIKLIDTIWLLLVPYRGFDTLVSLTVALFTLSPISHIIVRIEDEDSTVYLHSIRGKGIEWSSTPPSRQPRFTLSEWGHLDPSLVELCLPSGEKYSMLRTVLFGLFGLCKHSANCVTVVHRIRFLMGRETRRRSPYGVYKELRRQETVFHQ